MRRRFCVCRLSRSACALAVMTGSVLGCLAQTGGLVLRNTNAPTGVVRLFFIHHSTGENWLNDDHGGLGLALRDNHCFVSDSNYGWGPDSIGDTTDIGHWWSWFRSPDSARYMEAALTEDGQNCAYTRASAAPAGPNRVIMFKSCFPNSALRGPVNGSVPPAASNPLRGEDAYSEAHTVANAKGIYIDLLSYFGTKRDTFFVVVTAPPLSDPEYAQNARAFDQWLVSEWLAGYEGGNVFVFDFYNVLTSNGGSSEVSDVGQASGNHHRWREGGVEHKTNGGANVLKYPSSPDDDHPNGVGSRKATVEFIPLLNAAVNAWMEKASAPPRIGGFRRVDASVELEVRDLAVGTHYTLHRCTDLRSAVWVDAGGWVAASNVAVRQDAWQGDVASVFYRVCCP